MTCGTMKIYGHFSLKYWSPSFIMIINDGPKLWHMANKKLSHGILIVFWNTYI